jgi:hypothetical protein
VAWSWVEEDDSFDTERDGFGPAVVQNMVEMIGTLPDYEAGAVGFAVLGMIGTY